MPFLDNLKSTLQSLITGNQPGPTGAVAPTDPNNPSGVQGLFAQLAQNAIGGPAGVAQWQANNRNNSDLAAQAAQQAAQAQAKQQADLIAAIQKGAIPATVPGAPSTVPGFASRPIPNPAIPSGASAGQMLPIGPRGEKYYIPSTEKNDQYNPKDLITMIQNGAQIVPDETPGAVKYGPVSIFPGTKKPDGYTLGKDSDVGKFYGLDRDISGLTGPEYADKYQQYARDHVSKEQKAATSDTIDKQKANLENEAKYRFSDEYYNNTYGGKFKDGNAPHYLSSFMSELEDAAALDKRGGNTSRIDAATDKLRGFQSQAEKNYNELNLSASRSGADASAAMNVRYGPPPTPQEVKQWSDAVENYGTDYLSQARQQDPRLGQAVEGEIAKRGLNLFKLTTQEKDTQDLAKIGLPIAQKSMNILNTPGVGDSLSPVYDRWQDFLNGKVGTGANPAWKSLYDNLTYLKGNLGKLHYSARGGAQQHVQELLDSLFNAKKMDANTLRQGIMDAQGILGLYSKEGNPNGGNQGVNTPKTPIGFGGPGK